jgi:hypothetical protein
MRLEHAIATSLVLISLGCNGKKQVPTRFDDFYQDLINYSQVYNDSQIKPSQGNSDKEKELKSKVLEERSQFQGMERCVIERCGDEDVEKVLQAFENKGKVYAWVPSLYDSNVRSLILGDIVEIRNETFNDNNENLPYKMILFEERSRQIEEAKGVPARMSYWYHDRAYLNLTQAKKFANHMFTISEVWKKNGVSPSDFSNKMMFETYNNLIDDIKKKHPLGSRFKRYEHHEPMHKKYPSTEVEPCINQIGHTPNNGFIFWILGSTNSDVLDYLNGKGYSKERLSEMAPGQRSNADYKKSP